MLRRPNSTSWIARSGRAVFRGPCDWFPVCGPHAGSRLVGIDEPHAHARLRHDWQGGLAPARWLRPAPCVDRIQQREDTGLREGLREEPAMSQDFVYKSKDGKEY